MHRNAVAKPLTLFVVLGLLAACGGTTPASSGIYQLELVKQSDSCEPARHSEAQGEVFVRVTDEAIWAPMYEDSGIDGGIRPRVTREVRFSSPDARESVSMELLSDRNPIEIRLEETYTGVSGCNESNPNAYPIRPDTDCSAETLLRYTLVQKCESPCTVREIIDSNTLQGSFHCECPG
jgi:hypothetical protein